MSELFEERIFPRPAQHPAPSKATVDAGSTWLTAVNTEAWWTGWGRTKKKEARASGTVVLETRGLLLSAWQPLVEPGVLCLSGRTLEELNRNGSASWAYIPGAASAQPGPWQEGRTKAPDQAGAQQSSSPQLLGCWEPSLIRKVPQMRCVARSS